MKSIQESVIMSPTGHPLVKEEARRLGNKEVRKKISRPWNVARWQSVDECHAAMKNLRRDALVFIFLEQALSPMIPVLFPNLLTS